MLKSELELPSVSLKLLSSSPKFMLPSSWYKGTLYLCPLLFVNSSLYSSFPAGIKRTSCPLILDALLCVATPDLPCGGVFVGLVKVHHHLCVGVAAGLNMPGA